MADRFLKGHARLNEAQRIAAESREGVVVVDLILAEDPCEYPMEIDGVGGRGTFLRGIERCPRFLVRVLWGNQRCEFRELLATNLTRARTGNLLNDKRLNGVAEIDTKVVCRGGDGRCELVD